MLRSPLTLLLALGWISACGGAASDSPDGAVADRGERLDTGVLGTGTPAASNSGPRTTIIDHGAWEPSEPGDDPFEDRPAEVACALVGYGAEDLGGDPSFRVSMRDCDYMTATQTSTIDVQAGDELKVRLWYFPLNSSDPEAQAHAALAFDGHTQWEIVIPLPQDAAGVVSETFVASSDYPAGTEISYHVHNHGDNEYYLIELSRRD